MVLVWPLEPEKTNLEGGQQVVLGIDMLCYTLLKSSKTLKIIPALSSHRTIAIAEVLTGGAAIEKLTCTFKRDLNTVPTLPASMGSLVEISRKLYIGLCPLWPLPE